MGKDFTSLEIYRLAEDLVVEIYKLARRFPRNEEYGIISQLKRAVISVAINIAEAYGRYHFKDRGLFLYNSRGSLLEVKSLLLISCRLNYLKKGEVEPIFGKIDKLGVKINNFISYLKSHK